MRCKKTGIGCMLFAMIAVTACGKPQHGGIVEEELGTPQYETVHIESSDIESTQDIVDGWIASTFPFDGEDTTNFYPYVEHKIAGVYYYDDYMDYDNPGKIIDRVNMANKPMGCAVKREAGAGRFSQHPYNPEHIVYKGKEYHWANTPIETSVILEGTQIYTKQDTQSDTERLPYEVSMQDVQAISCALYENFFDTIPAMRIRIYGIPTSVFAQKVSADMKFSKEVYRTFQKEYQKNQLQEFDLLAEKNIEKTGVYYVDYTQIQGDYIQYLIKIDFSQAVPYCYQINANGVYMVEKQEQYQEWKEQHREQFIEANENL